MPFGVCNAPAVFKAVMYDFTQSWDELSKKHDMETDRSNNINIIIDDVMVFDTSVDTIFILSECTLETRITKHHHQQGRLIEIIYWDGEIGRFYQY